MADFKSAPREKNSLDNTKFNLSAKNEKGQRASLMTEMVGNNPRFTIYTNIPEDKENNYGRIQAKLDPVVFMLIIDRLEDMARKGEGKKIYSIDNMKQKFVNNKPVDEWYPLNTVKFGRDEDGQIWISVVEKNRPKIKFVFTQPQYHVLKNPDNSDLAPGEVSRMFTLAWCGVFRTLLGPCMNTNYVPPKPRDPQGGGGQGGYNKGGNGGNYNKGSGGGNGGGGSSMDDASAGIDDDLWS